MSNPSVTATGDELKTPYPSIAPQKQMDMGQMIKFVVTLVFAGSNHFDCRSM
tara:strand:+ start:693 stop:848 length:156 start_codon:yes stop_codon:yes gene_type:complete